jgi:hypothetical protein
VTTFALVHGGWHGAWCWEAVTPSSMRAAHNVVAVDLPSDDPNADFDTYADVVCMRSVGRTTSSWSGIPSAA